MFHAHWIFKYKFHLPQIRINIVLPCTLWPPARSLSLGFPAEALYAFLDCSIRASCPARLSRLDLELLITFGE